MLPSILLAVVMGALPAMADINFDNLTCDVAEGRLCGAGTCLADFTCQCDAYYSTINDFVTIPGDCSTNVIGIYVLWALNAVVLCYSYFKAFGVIWQRFESFLETKRTRKGYTLWDNKGLLGIFAYYLISTPFHWIMTVLHFVHPEAQIGFDLLPSLCFFFAKLGFYLMIVLVQGSMLAAALKGNKRYERLVRGNYAFQFTVNSVSIALGSFAFLPMTVLLNNPQGQISLMQAYYLIQAAALFGQAAGAVIIIVRVNHALNVGKDLIAIPSGGGEHQPPVVVMNTGSGTGTGTTGEQTRTERIRAKVNDLQKTSMKQAIMQGVVYLLMGAIPFFINKHQYFLPMSWLAMPIIGNKLAHQFIADTNAKTVLQRLVRNKQGSAESQKDQGALQSPMRTGRVTDLHTFQSDNPLVMRQASDLQKQSSAVSSGGTTGEGFEDLLNPTHESHREFNQFVQQKHAGNEVRLLQLTLQYRRATDSKERTKMGRLMVKEFVEQGAPSQVDLPSEIRDILLSTAKRNQFVATTFDQIRRTLAFDLKGNFMGQFEAHLEKQRQQKRMG